jgi:heterodisulfide reductase subunit A
MGVAKSATLEAQEEIESSLVRKILVIGGGMAGLSAAEALGMGLEVILVEKEQRLGGLLNDLNVLDNGESAAERIARLGRKVSPY